jgi:transcriptional regulator with XRE-family HTH domain
MSKTKNSNNQDKRIEEICLFVRNWRLNEGLSQREFSHLSNKHLNTIQKFESGSNVTVRSLLAIIDAMDMNLQQFIECLR